MAALLVVYFVIVSWISGWNFALGQFADFWYFIVSLAAGFGLQIGLYVRLKERVAAMHQEMGGKKVLAVSGTTSTVAMISCCVHYLANILPILGAVGAVTIISQYQIQLFWVGLAFNAAGILYMLKKLNKIGNAT